MWKFGSVYTPGSRDDVMVYLLHKLLLVAVDSITSMIPERSVNSAVIRNFSVKGLSKDKQYVILS